jgi:hypothetical protein
MMAGKSNGTIQGCHQQGNIQQAAVIADNQEAASSRNPFTVMQRYLRANGTKQAA